MNVDVLAAYAVLLHFGMRILDVRVRVHESSRIYYYSITHCYK